jgi:hypothetical protein
MGWWKSQNGVIGDRPADILDAALNAIEHIYVQESGRRPTQGELADLIQFCSAGVFDVACGDPKYEFSKKTLHLESVPRRCRRGAQGASGVANQPKPGELGNADPKTGDHMEAGELKEVLADQVKKASGFGQRIPDAEGSP